MSDERVYWIVACAECGEQYQLHHARNGVDPCGCFGATERLKVIRTPAPSAARPTAPPDDLLERAVNVYHAEYHRHWRDGGDAQDHDEAHRCGLEAVLMLNNKIAQARANLVAIEREIRDDLNRPNRMADGAEIEALARLRTLEEVRCLIAR